MSDFTTPTKQPITKTVPEAPRKPKRKGTEGTERTKGTKHALKDVAKKL